MFYHDQCQKVIADYKEGLITKEAALRKIGDIEENAYTAIPDAEPDGDITFAAAMAVEEIRSI